MTRTQSRAFAEHVRTEALYYRLDARLLVALVAIESSWHPYVTSPVGAGGLGQLMPGTAAGLGVDAYEPNANLSGTAHYLRGLLDRFGAYNQPTRYAFALAGYNAGPGAVLRFGGVPPYAETQNYVRNVMGVWRQLCAQLSSHIDDYIALAKTPMHPSPHRLSVRAQHVAFHSFALSADRRSQLPARSSVIAQVIALPEGPTHKPFLYYLFHRHRAQSSQSATTADSGQALHMRVSAGAAAGDAISVELHATDQPVTLLAFIGNRLVARGRLPAHTTHALIRGIPTADTARVVVVHAYAQGYDQANVALTIAGESTKVSLLNR